jgi:hypothetical protein
LKNNFQLAEYENEGGSNAISYDEDEELRLRNNE